MLLLDVYNVSVSQYFVSLYLCIYAATRLFCIWYLPVLLLFSLSRNPPSAFLFTCFVFSVFCSLFACCFFVLPPILFCSPDRCVVPGCCCCSSGAVAEVGAAAGAAFEAMRPGWFSRRPPPAAVPPPPGAAVSGVHYQVSEVWLTFPCHSDETAAAIMASRPPRAGLRKLLRSYLFIWCGHRLIHLPPGGTAGLAISGDIGQGLPTHYLSSGRPAEPIRFGHDLDAD